MAYPQELLIEIEDEQNIEIGLNSEQNLDVELDYDVVRVSDSRIHSDTTSNWASQPFLIAMKDHIYVYTDYVTLYNEPVPGIKIGDGTSYLIDLPFVSGNTRSLYEHITDRIKHVSLEERLAWNNKVTCFMSAVDPEGLVFTKRNEE